MRGVVVPVKRECYPPVTPFLFLEGNIQDLCRGTDNWRYQDAVNVPPSALGVRLPPSTPFSFARTKYRMSGCQKRPKVTPLRTGRSKRKPPTRNNFYCSLVELVYAADSNPADSDGSCGFDSHKSNQFWKGVGVRLIELVLKTSRGNTHLGSNPSPSSIYNHSAGRPVNKAIYRFEPWVSGCTGERL